MFLANLVVQESSNTSQIASIEGDAASFPVFM
jgi:hypothetical protein